MRCGWLAIAGIAICLSNANWADAQHHSDGHHGGSHHGSSHHSDHTNHHGGQHHSGWTSGHHNSYSNGHANVDPGYSHHHHGGPYTSFHNPDYSASYYNGSSNYVQSNMPPGVMQQPIYGGGVIRIVNPATSLGLVRYSLNTYPYSIQPGQSQTIESTRVWVASFDRGHGEVARYTLRPGEYYFGTTTDGHWELYRNNSPTQTASDAPEPPAGPAASTAFQGAP